MRISVLSVGFDNITMEEALDTSMALMRARKSQGQAESCPYIVTPNPEMIMYAQKDHAFAAVLSEASLSLADGIGVIYGAKLLHSPLKEKIPGIDFATNLMERMAKEHMSVFLYGAKPGVSSAAGKRLAEAYPGLVIAGDHDGYDKDEEAVLQKINASGADFLFVCLGFPKQELWIQKNRSRCQVGLCAALGGSLDVLSGEVERAPEQFQKLGLEWFYRLLKEPQRIGRMLVLPQYLIKVMSSRRKEL